MLGNYKYLKCTYKKQYFHEIPICSLFYFYIIERLDFENGGPWALIFIMTFRGMTTIGLVLSIAVIQKISFKELYSKTAFCRLGLGGMGLSLQLAAAQFLPVSALAFTTRSMPVWLAVFVSSSIIKRICAVIFLLTLLFLVIFNHGAIAIVALISPLFLALSQIQQSHAAKTEASVLLPLAPAVGLFIIGVFGLFLKHEVLSLKVVYLSTLSGLIMSITYWLAIPLFKSKGLKTVSQIDIASSLFFVCFGILESGFMSTAPFLILGVISFLLLRLAR
jgi:hypothetical protein